MGRRRDIKIENIKTNLLPLLSYIDPNSGETESYEWTSGDKCFGVKKYFIDDLMEVYAYMANVSKSGKTKNIARTYMYQLPFSKGNTDFIDADGWTFQVV